MLLPFSLMKIAMAHSFMILTLGFLLQGLFWGFSGQQIRLICVMMIGMRFFMFVDIHIYVTGIFLFVHLWDRFLLFFFTELGLCLGILSIKDKQAQFQHQLHSRQMLTTYQSLQLQWWHGWSCGHRGTLLTQTSHNGYHLIEWRPGNLRLFAPFDVELKLPRLHCALGMIYWPPFLQKAEK